MILTSHQRFWIEGRTHRHTNLYRQHVDVIYLKGYLNYVDMKNEGV